MGDVGGWIGVFQSLGYSVTLFQSKDGWRAVVRKPRHVTGRGYADKPHKALELAYIDLSRIRIGLRTKLAGALSAFFVSAPRAALLALQEAMPRLARRQRDQASD